MVSSSRSIKPEPENSVKKFTRFISQSSQRFLASFIDPDSEEEKQTNHIFQQINQAIAQKSIVVIQYRDDLQAKATDRFETLVGRIYQHADNPEALVIKLQKNNQVRMISAKNIKKSSVINHNVNSLKTSRK